MGTAFHTEPIMTSRMIGQNIVRILVMISFVVLGCAPNHKTTTYHEQKEEPRLDEYEPDVWIAPSRREPIALDGGSLDSAPELTNEKTPEYPILPLRAGIEGVLVLEVVVGIDGVVAEISTVSSGVTPSMERSAVETIRHFVYRPGARNGKPVACRLEIPVHFCVR
jgi:TonB family protein